jgi:hypothetical protein
MGNDLIQWRSSIGGFTGGGIQLIVSRDANNYHGDMHLAIFFLILLVTSSSVHPNPGPTFGHQNTNKPFYCQEENKIFNQIRHLEGKLLRMESHSEFIRFCIQHRLIPNGIDFKLHLSTAFQGRQLDLQKALTQSKFSILNSISQHYETQIPFLRHQINELYERLSYITESSRYEELKKDLRFFSKKTRDNCKKNKLIKIKKLEKNLSKGVGNSGRSTNDSWLPSLGLKQKEKNIILSNQWLNDEIINAASSILRKKHPHV